MATANKRANSEPTSGIVVVQRTNDDGKWDEQKHYASASVKWVVDGLADGTVKLVEEVPADATQVPSQGNVANAGGSGTGS